MVDRGGGETITDSKVNVVLALFPREKGLQNLQ